MISAVTHKPKMWTPEENNTFQNSSHWIRGHKYLISFYSVSTNILRVHVCYSYVAVTVEACFSHEIHTHNIWC